MRAHNLQLALNLFTFTLGAFIFWTFSGKDSMFDASYLEYGQAIFGILLMCATAYVAFYPCEHRTEPIEDASAPSRDKVPTQ